MTVLEITLKTMPKFEMSPRKKKNLTRLVQSPILNCYE